MNGTKTFVMMIAISIAAISAPAAASAQSVGGFNLGNYIPGGLNLGSLGNYIPGYNGGYNNGSNNNGTLRDQGVISQVNGTNIILQDGRSVFLHQGTVINPRGTTLQAGQRVYVQGTPGGNGAINANEVDVNGTASGGYNGGYNNGGYNNGGYNGGYNNGNNTGYNNGNDTDDHGRWHRHDKDKDKDDNHSRNSGNNGQYNNGNNNGNNGYSNRNHGDAQ